MLHSGKKSAKPATGICLFRYWGAETYDISSPSSVGEAFLSAGIMKGSSMWHFRAAVLTLWIISSILLFITVQIHINSNSNDSNTAATLPGEASSTQCRKVAAEHQFWHNPGQGTWPNRRLHLWRQTQIQWVISLIFLKRKGMTFADADELVHGWQVYGVISMHRWKAGGNIKTPQHTRLLGL